MVCYLWPLPKAVQVLQVPRVPCQCCTSQSKHQRLQSSQQNKLSAHRSKTRNSRERYGSDARQISSSSEGGTLVARARENNHQHYA